MSKKALMSKILLTAVLVAQASVPAAFAAEDGATRIFDINFNSATADGPISLTSHNVTNTWVDGDNDNNFSVTAQDSNSGVNYSLTSGVYGKAATDKSLEINGHNGDGAKGEERIGVFTHGVNKSYTTTNTLDCGKGGMFSLSFDFATNDLDVPIRVSIARVIENTDSGLAEYNPNEDLFWVNANGSIKIYDMTVSETDIKAALGKAIGENEWHNIKLIFTTDGKVAAVLDGHVVKQLTSVGKFAGKDIRGLYGELRLYSSSGKFALDSSVRNASKRYIDNIKYEKYAAAVTAVEDDLPALSFTDDKVYDYKNASVIYPAADVTAKAFTDSITATKDGEALTVKLVDNSGNALADDASASKAALLVLTDSDAISYCTKIAQRTEVTLDAVPTALGISAGNWNLVNTSNYGYAIENVTGKGGKASEDNSIRFSRKNVQDNEKGNMAYLDYWVSTGDIFTVEYSLLMKDNNNVGCQQQIGLKGTTDAQAVVVKQDGTVSAGSSAVCKVNQWERYCVVMNPIDKKCETYLNGVKIGEKDINMNFIDRVRFQFIAYGDCEAFIDDIKITTGNAVCSQKPITLTGNDKIAVDNEACTIVAALPAAKADLTSLCGEGLSAKLFADKTYTNEADTAASGSVLVVTDGNGMYKYYTIVPDVEITYSIADGVLTAKAVLNGAQGAGNVVLYAAKYTDEQLSGVGMNKGVLANTKDYVSATLSVDEDDKDVRIFLWTEEAQCPVLSAMPVNK